MHSILLFSRRNMNSIDYHQTIFFVFSKQMFSFSCFLFDWFILVILGLSAGFFYVFWYFGYQKVDGVMASLSTAAMPLATVLIAWLLLGERLTQAQTLGMSMVILSIIAYARR